MHLGNYNGALRGWIEVAKVAKESLFFSADWHALTSDYKDPSGIAAAARDVRGLDRRRPRRGEERLLHQSQVKSTPSCSCSSA
jgi:hypothetical protein